MTSNDTDLNAKQKEQIDKFQWWLIGLRTAVISLFTVLGLSIGGILSFPTYLDNEVNEAIVDKNQDLMDLIYGGHALGMGDNLIALERFSRYLDKIENKDLDIDDEAGALFLSNYLYAIAYEMNVDEQHQFEVFPFYDKLKESKFYKKNYIIYQRYWKQDPTMVKVLAIIKLKFAKSPEEINEALILFNKSLQIHQNNTQETIKILNLTAIIYLLRNDEEEKNFKLAQANLEKIIALDPSVFHLASGDIYRDFPEDIFIWKNVAKIMKVEDLEDRYKHLISSIQ